MFKARYYKVDGKKGRARELPESLFDGVVNEGVLHQVVKAYLANQRQGTHSAKNRAAVAGGSRKPWRQKGTGRARQGSSRATQFRGGMTVFGPSPRGYAFKVTKKARKLALKSVLTDRLRSQAFTVVENLSLENPKTREAAALLKTMGLPERTLFLIDGKNDNLTLAVRNLPHVDVLPVEGLNVYDLLLHDRIVCTPESLKKIEERLS